MTAGATLRERLAELGARFPEVVAVGPTADGPTRSLATWARRGLAFAVLGERGVELRLDAAVAEAAARTPDAHPSDRGPEWVRFDPRTLDGHALDRLEAWFELAVRRAGAESARSAR